MNITTKFIVIIAVNLLPAYLIAQRGRGRIYNGKEPDLGPLDLEQCLIGAGLILAGYLVYKVTSDSESGFGITLSIILWIAGLLLNINLIFKPGAKLAAAGTLLPAERGDDVAHRQPPAVLPHHCGFPEKPPGGT